MKKVTLKLSLFFFIFLMSSFITTSFAYAFGNGEIKPLSYVSCTLDDGSSIDNPNGITLEPKFTLLFDKNVVDILVWNNNRNCISLSTDNNVNVPIDVSKIDDTVDFEHRQQIFVSPLNALSPDKTYRIYISPNLTAKNGVATLGGTTAGKGITVTFKTKKQEVPQNTNTTSTSNQSDTQQNTQGASGGQSNEGNTPVAVTNTTNENSTNVVATPNTTSENKTNVVTTSSTTGEGTTNAITTSNTTSQSTTNAVATPSSNARGDTTNIASQNNSQTTTSEQPKTEDDKNAEGNKSTEYSSKAAEEVMKGSSESEVVNESEILMGKSASEDSSAKWMYFITGTIIFSWIAIEFIFKRRRIKESRNNHVGEEV